MNTEPLGLNRLPMYLKGKIYMVGCDIKIDDINDVSNKLLLEALGIGLLCIFLSSVAAYIVSKAIVANLSKISGFIGKVVVEDFDLTAKVEVTSKLTNRQL